MNLTKLILPAAVALAAVAGCNKVPPPTETRLDPYPSPQVVPQSQKLRQSTAVDMPRLARDEVSGNLLLTVPIRNTTDRLLTVDYYVTWLDAAGRPTSAGRVGPFTKTLPPNASIFLTADAPTSDAADFLMDVRYAE